MTDSQRKYLIALAAEAVSNPDVAQRLPSATLRQVILAIDEEMGRPSDPEIVVDNLLHSLGVRWIPLP